MFGGIGVNLSQARAQISARQTAIGRKYSLIQAHYDGGGTYGGVFGCEDPTLDNTGSAVVPPSQEQWAFDNGSDFMVAWTPSFTLAQFLAGAADEIWTKMARYWAGFGRTILLRAFHEFDIASYGIHGPGGPYPAEQFRSAWERMVRLMRPVAPNVEFVWCPTEGAIDRALCASCYPGASYVDFIASDWYNTASWATPLHDGWASFEELFHYDALGSPLQSKYSFSVEQGKPFLVAETGSVFDVTAPARKAQWWEAIPDALSRMPNCKGVSVYDVNVSPAGDYDWRVDSTASRPSVTAPADPATLSGFAAMAKQLA